MASIIDEANKEKVAETPSTPITSRSRAYKLEFRHKNRLGLNSGRTQEKVFWYQGNLKDAVARIRLHCEKMNYTYIYCYPFIVDLDAQEEMKSKDINGTHEGVEY